MLLDFENWPPDGARETKAPLVAMNNASCGKAVQANSVTVTLPPTKQKKKGADHKLAIVPVIVPYVDWKYAALMAMNS